MIEKTLVLLKPDAVKRNLSGTIISRFESSGLKIKAMKLTNVSENLAKEHYFLDEQWAKNVFDKTLDSYQKEKKEMK